MKNTPYDKVFKNENTFLARNTNGFYHLNWLTHIYKYNIGIYWGLGVDVHYSVYRCMWMVRKYKSYLHCIVCISYKLNTCYWIISFLRHLCCVFIYVGYTIPYILYNRLYNISYRRIHFPVSAWLDVGYKLYINIIRVGGIPWL